MVSPSVSVVLLTHDRPEWLPQALNSVLRGAFDDLEIIVSDNGDPAGSRLLAQSVADSRVRWVEYSRESDMLEHFLAALGHARGEYVAVLHDDDWWEPDFLAVLVPALERRADTVVAFCDHNIVDAFGAVDQSDTEAVTREFGRADLAVGYQQPFFELVARQSIAMTGCVFRNGALKVSDITADVGGFLDVWVGYLLASTEGAAFYSDRRLLNYRRHGTSTTSARQVEGYRASIRYRSVMRDDPRMRRHDDVLRARLARDHLSLGAALLRLGARGDARTHLMSSWKLGPSVKAVVGLAATWLVPAQLFARLS